MNKANMATNKKLKETKRKKASLYIIRYSTWT
jgi:hypothetical protein